jgi:hypothetical protein
MQSCSGSDSVLKVGYCMTPYHVLETLAFFSETAPMTIVCAHADHYREVLGDFDGLELIDMNDRRRLLTRLTAERTPFDFYFATVWNRTALLFEKTAMKSGGHINIIDDGAGGFNPAGTDWRIYVRRIAYALLDGTQYCDNPKQKHFDRERTTFYSVVPELSAAPVKPLQIDMAALRNLLPRVERHFDHLRPYRGMPAFFDTNDCESGWYPFEKKIEILRDLLPDEPTIYLPHPAQRLSPVSDLPNLIDLGDQTRHWNEMACYFLRPKAVYSVFSTTAFTLRNIFGLTFENKYLFQEFYRRTGHASFNIPPNMRAYFAGLY